jgi:quercetin dioxygenase-like cupin family protein
LSLTALAREQLKIARQASSGRSAQAVYGGHEHVLRQTLITPAAGHQLDVHDSPGEATVHVLHGRVRLGAGEVGLAEFRGQPRGQTVRIGYWCAANARTPARSST